MSLGTTVWINLQTASLLEKMSRKYRWKKGTTIQEALRVLEEHGPVKQ